MSTVVGEDLDGPWDHGEFTVTCSRRPRPDLTAASWALYEDAFAPLRQRAVARQMMTEPEFAAELNDPRVWKYVALDADGELAGLTTLTDDVSTMPWISPEYFQHHYPDEWRRNAVFYIGATLVRPDMRRHQVFATMTKHVGMRVAATRGVLGYDICGHNDQDRARGLLFERILHRVARFSVRPVDVQTYYVVRATAGRGKDGT